jgi:hypothetical protein
LQVKLTEPLLSLLKNKELPVRISAAKAVAYLDIKQASPVLIALVKNDPVPDMRIESLTALVALDDAQVGEAVSQALSDKEKKVRVAGLKSHGENEYLQRTDNIIADKCDSHQNDGRETSGDINPRQITGSEFSKIIE